MCLSESTTEHLAFLIGFWAFQPWGLVITREQAFSEGGGAVAYVPRVVHDRMRGMFLGHWAVPIDEKSIWMHEREWRIPLDERAALHIGPGRLEAILVADAGWRPEKVPAGHDAAQAETGSAQPLDADYPPLWRETPVWVWDRTAKDLVKYKPGTVLKPHGEPVQVVSADGG